MDLNEALLRGDEGRVADLGLAQLHHGLLLLEPNLGSALDAVASALTSRRRAKLLNDMYRGPTCPPAWTFINRLQDIYGLRRSSPSPTSSAVSVNAASKATPITTAPPGS